MSANLSEFVRPIDRPAKPIASRLPHLDLELTERCNNNCIHCCINRPANDVEARARELTTAQVQDILQQAAGLGCLQVRLTGGEPLLRPDFEALYLFARRLGMKVLLFTNGCLITPRLADLFAHVPPRSKIEISVYGMRAESYEAVTRVPGSFTQFWRGVNLLLDRQVPFVVKGALLPPNRAEVDDFETWARTIPWMTGPPSYAMNYDLRNRRDDEARNAQIASLRLSPQDTVKMLTREEAKYRGLVQQFASKFMGPPGEALFNCGASSDRGGCVDAYGRLQPCLGLRASELTVDVVGVFEKTPSDFETRVFPQMPLQGALAQFPRLQDLRATNPEYLRRCARCFLKGFCEQCPAKSWSENGTLDTPVEYLCDVAHAQARWLGWLNENEYAWVVERETWKERIKQCHSV